jgi:uncharacterized lipoprotein YddW (UPF0748 family)
MQKIRNILIFTCILTWCVFSLPPHHLSGAVSPKNERLGIWITVFSEEKVLHSKENADKLLASCEKLGIDHIYLQVYRSGKAYYNSQLTDRSAYEDILKSAGEDTLKYLIQKSKDKNIRIYAWMNVLSLARNEKADILKKYGNRILTKDEYGRTPLHKGKKDELDKFYIREDQLFLEPGEERVRKYLAGIAEEIVKKYPGLDGIHLDYIRYPAVVPFSPGSRFTPPGISYGYGKENLKSFKKETGLDVKKMEGTRKNFQKWDDWRRDRVTELVRAISEKARGARPDLEISCTIVPSIERTYMVNFQDWTKWLMKGYIDWVVVMNYTDNTELMKLNSRSLLFPQLNEKIYIGVGAFLMEKNPDSFKKQIEFLRKTKPGGIVIFCYEDIMQNPELQGPLLSEAGS